MSEGAGRRKRKRKRKTRFECAAAARVCGSQDAAMVNAAFGESYWILDAVLEGGGGGAGEGRRGGGI